MLIRIDIKFIFAVILLILFIATGWFMVSYNRYRNYQIIVTEPVSGLRVDSPVQFNGVVVGQVWHIDFDRENPSRIKILIRIEKSTPITEGTQASFANLQQVNLEDVGKNLKPLERQPGQNYPKIPMMPSEGIVVSNQPLVEISKSLQKSHKLFDNILAEENVELLKQLLYSIQQITNVLVANSDKVNSLIIHSEQVSRAMLPVLKSSNATFIELMPLLKSSQDTLYTLRNQTLPQTYLMMTNFNQTMEELQKLTLKLNENPSVIIRGSRPPKLGPGEQIHYSNSRNRKHGC